MDKFRGDLAYLILPQEARSLYHEPGWLVKLACRIVGHDLEGRWAYHLGKSGGEEITCCRRCDYWVRRPLVKPEGEK